MTDDQFNALWLLTFCIGLVLAFGLGAIKGGQR
ncbi:tail virion protein G7P-2 [Salinicola endophyticus]|uniref:Tail virion protein G7P-2 n=1 Tax=Salinicola endophyticus TaxID=1949083 RepID=A0AB74UAJ6_9GAMM